MMAGHTVLPWGVWQGDKIVAYAVSRDGEEYDQVIALSDPDVQCSEREARANAEFITRACNAHYDLLEACEAFDNWLKEKAGTIVMTFGKDELDRAITVADMVADAIAKAKPEGE